MKEDREKAILKNKKMSKEKTYSIQYFSSKTKKVQIKTFEGKNAFEDANNWGKENLDNFFDDLIYEN